MTIINQTSHGVMFKCDACNKYHIEFKNINLNFTQEQLDNFVGYLDSFDFDKSFEVSRYTPYCRKIMLSMKHLSCNLLFHKCEIEELYDLLTFRNRSVETAYIKLLDKFNIKPFVD